MPVPLVVLGVTAVLLPAAVLYYPAGMADLGIYLAQGQHMALNGGLADTDVWTHTAGGVHYINTTWLAQRAFFNVWRGLGYAGLRWLPAVAAAATILIVGAGVRRVCGRPGTVALAGPLVAILIAQNMAVRPELFALPLFAAYMTLNVVWRPTWRTMIASGAIVALWANLHGSFPVAVVASGLLAAGVGFEALVETEGSLVARVERAVRRTVAWDGGGPHLATAGIALLATLANPYGLGAYRYVLTNVGQSNEFGGGEWGATSILSLAGVRLLAALFGLWVQTRATGHKIRLRDLPLVCAFVGLAFVSMRYVVWLAMILPFAMAFLSPRAERKEEERGLSPWIAAVVGIVGLAIVVVVSPNMRLRSSGASTEDEKVAQLFEGHTYLDATRFVESSEVHGDVFNTYGWASWLEWRLGEDRLRTFMDIRLWIFTPAVWAHYQQICQAKDGWDARLAEYHVRYALLEREWAAPLIEAMTTAPDWETLYEDADVAVFARRETAASGVPAGG